MKVFKNARHYTFGSKSPASGIHVLKGAAVEHCIPNERQNRFKKTLETFLKSWDRTSSAGVCRPCPQLNQTDPS